MPTIVPANSNTYAFVLLPGAPTVIAGRVIAWRIDESTGAPPMPITVPPAYAGRVAVRFGESPTLFEWPNRVHASPDEFCRSAA